MLSFPSYPYNPSLDNTSKTLRGSPQSQYKRASSFQELRTSTSPSHSPSHYRANRHSKRTLTGNRGRSTSCSRMSKVMIDDSQKLEFQRRETLYTEMDYPGKTSRTNIERHKVNKMLKSTDSVGLRIMKLPTQDGTEFTCPICYCECEVYNTVETTTCKHRFCRDCARSYLARHIEEFTVLNIKCPQDQCAELYRDIDIQATLDKTTYATYCQKKELKLRNKDTKIRYCPQPGCANAFHPDPKSKSTKCKCGTVICNECISPWHQGKPCSNPATDEYELFLEMNNIKKCFICKTGLDKHIGCSHITCPVCDYEWCWNCGREWEPGHSSRCGNKWNPHPPRALQQENHLNGMDHFFNGVFLFLEILVFWIVVMIGVVLVWPFAIFRKFMDMMKKKTKSNALARIASILLAILTWPLAMILYPISAIFEEYGMICRRKRWLKGGINAFGFNQTFASKINRPQLSLGSSQKTVSEIAAKAGNLVVDKKEAVEVVIKQKTKSKRELEHTKETKAVQKKVEVIVE